MQLVRQPDEQALVNATDRSSADEDQDHVNTTEFTDVVERKFSGKDTATRVLAPREARFDNSKHDRRIFNERYAMNTSKTNYSEDHNADYSVTFRSRSESPSGSRTSRPTFGRSRGKNPQQHNGIHRRRRKKIRW